MPPFRTRTLITASLVLLFSAALPGTLQAASLCLTAPEARAERIRIVQTELMIAALRCTSRPELRLKETYDRFVRDFTPQLVENARILSNSFKRRYGAAHQEQLDSFITGLANRISLVSGRDPGFCEAAAGFGGALLASGRRAFPEARLDDPLLIEPDLPLCPTVAAQPIAPMAFPRD